MPQIEISIRYTVRASEQRLDASGVDGESVWFAQSKQPADDCVALVQPSAERTETIKKKKVPRPTVEPPQPGPSFCLSPALRLRIAW